MVTSLVRLFSLLLFPRLHIGILTQPHYFDHIVQDEVFDQPPSDDEIGEFGDSDIEEMEDEERNAYAILLRLVEERISLTRFLFLSAS